MYLDTPEENIFDEFQERIFAGHPLAHNILGTEESVNEISQTALKILYQPIINSITWFLRWLAMCLLSAC